MAYKKYFYRNGKKFGPYYYESYRDKTGKVKKRYVGTADPDKIARPFKIEKKIIVLGILFIGILFLILFFYNGFFLKDINAKAVANISCVPKIFCAYNEIAGHSDVGFGCKYVGPDDCGNIIVCPYDPACIAKYGMPLTPSGNSTENLNLNQSGQTNVSASTPRNSTVKSFVNSVMEFFSFDWLFNNQENFNSMYGEPTPTSSPVILQSCYSLTPYIENNTLVYFLNGSYISAGNYSVYYLNGSFNWNSPNPVWAVNLWSLAGKGYHVVYNSGDIQGPGTDGYYDSPDLVPENNTPVNFSHAGGNISMYLDDGNSYSDNTPGNPNPSFALCPEGISPFPSPTPTPTPSPSPITTQTPVVTSGGGNFVPDCILNTCKSGECNEISVYENVPCQNKEGDVVRQNKNQECFCDPGSFCNAEKKCELKSETPVENPSVNVQACSYYSYTLGDVINFQNNACKNKIITKKIICQGENYLGVYDLNGNLISKIKLSSGNPEKLDVNFILTSNSDCVAG